ncbi:hypothetical protein KSY17_01100, partial [Bacteroides sp. MSK.18.22]|nr:hypothetical protein [Bacteroides sp. MSK.18.91]MBV3666480.1 hypothetical protein [Bacteroides sp. MSK.18.83]MBV3710869.1 hypothetical protein [Bacteroides sp. MSK.18.39]MBV3737674.1 hypothetical protein [Bacteroides sp. MSK.18.37]MBV3752728.1 hypothetical protein [Bacteroides sp. MSK.18.22]
KQSFSLDFLERGTFTEYPYVDGTVFIEGMVYFKNKWYLYYGCADSKVGVAVYDPKRPAKADPLP